MFNYTLKLVRALVCPWFWTTLSVQGDVTVFSRAKLRMGDGDFDFSGGTHHIALTDGTTAPIENATDPRFAAGGTPNFLAEEVTPGGNYAAGGAAVDPADPWTLTGAIATFDLNDFTWSQNAGNPTNATECVSYQNDANDYCLFFLDIGGVFNMTTGDLAITWNASGVFTLT